MISIRKNKYDSSVRDKIYNLFEIIQNIDRIDILQEKIRSIVNTDSFKKINFNKCVNTVKCKYTEKYDIIMSFNNDQRQKSTNMIEITENGKYYVFMISTLGFKFFEIFDSLEYDRSHLHIIDNNNEGVIITGEVSVNNKGVFYNFLSGTFSLVIKNEYKEYYFSMLHIFKALIEIVLLLVTEFKLNISYTECDILKPKFKNTSLYASL